MSPNSKAMKKRFWSISMLFLGMKTLGNYLFWREIFVYVSIRKEIAVFSPYINLNNRIKATATSKRNVGCPSRSRRPILNLLLTFLDIMS